MADGSFKPLRGFRDLLPPDSELTTALEAAARETLALYGYAELRLPALELRELFVKATGETTDIVEKEMFQFEDAGGRRVALRPEGTPGAVRAFLDARLSQQGAGAKLFYSGPMYRAERPQAGRYREFLQIGVEYFGNPHPAADAECILALRAVFARAGVADSLRLRLNNLGCDASAECRPAFRSSFREFLRAREDSLCESCRRRIERNPLRALDCKSDGPRLAEQAPRLKPCPPCFEHVEAVARLLASAGCDRIDRDPNLVRGLDYYTRTVFEFASDLVGSQDALAGGGRYDALVAGMGGPPTPAVGWALGVERSLLAASKLPGALEALRRGMPAAELVFVASAGPAPALAEAGVRALEELRRFGIRAAGGLFAASLKSQLREAGRRGARYAVILGESELAAAIPSCTVKDMSDGSQRAVPLSALPETLGDELIPHESRV